MRLVGKLETRGSCCILMVECNQSQGRFTQRTTKHGQKCNFCIGVHKQRLPQIMLLIGGESLYSGQIFGDSPWQQAKIFSFSVLYSWRELLKLYQKHVGDIFSSMIMNVLCINKHSEWRPVQVLSSGYYFLPNNIHEKIYPF